LCCFSGFGQLSAGEEVQKKPEVTVENGSTPAKPQGKAEEAKEPAPAGIVLEPKVLDYGEFREGQLRQRRITLTNQNEQPVTISRAYSPCPCINILLRERTIPAKGSLAIDVEVHSLTLSGEETWKLFFQLKGAVTGAVMAEAKTNVKRVPAQIMVHPEAAHLGTVTGDKLASAEVRFFNLTKKPIRILQVECDTPGLTATVEGVGPVQGGMHRLIRVVAEKETFKPGPIAATLKIQTDCGLHALILVPVQGTALAAGEPAAETEKK
jgi:hypothetical protein